MVAFALTRTAVLFAASLLVGCASDPGLPRMVTVEHGRPVRVVLQRQGQSQSFSLQNASSTDAAGFYRDAEPLAKVAPDAQLQALLDVLAAKGMFAAADGPVTRDAREALAIEQDGRRWVWIRRRGGAAEDALAFQEALAYFLEVYNSSTAYHPSEQAPDLGAERERLQREGAATRSRHEQGERP